MPSKKEFLDFVLEQLDNQDITYRKMMGEYILYLKGQIIGGIYDDRFLLKERQSLIDFLGENLQYAIPYENAKKMIFIENVDDKEFLEQLLSVLEN